MYAYELCRRYQGAINRKDLPAVLDLFVPGAIAKAPISGMLQVGEFFPRLFRHDKICIARLSNIFESMGAAKATALRYDCTCVLKNGKLINFDCLTIFEIDEDRKRFSSVSIYYDASDLRRYLKDEQIEGLPLY